MSHFTLPEIKKLTNSVGLSKELLTSGKYVMRSLNPRYKTKFTLATRKASPRTPAKKQATQSVS